MVCIVEHIFEDGEWAIMEWKDPLGLRGCGFFHVQNDKIVFQRGYWDKLSFLKQHGLPVENSDEIQTHNTVRYGNHHSFFRVRFFQRFVCGILICIQRLWFLFECGWIATHARPTRIQSTTIFRSIFEGRLISLCLTEQACTTTSWLPMTQGREPYLHSGDYT